MSTRTSNLALGLVVFLAAPLAAVTGAASHPEQSKPAAQIFADSEKAMLGAKNFHVVGSITQGGQDTTLNLTISPSGGGGSVGLPGVTMEIVVAGHNVYVKADEKSWLKLTGSKATAELVANRWIEAPASNADFADFAQLTDSKSFIDQVGSGKSQVSKFPVTARWGGRKAIILTDTEGDRLYVADGPTPYMLHIQGGSSGASGYMTFTDFGTAPVPTIPVNPINFPNS
ncbi:MAG TPA: hypothetical protein VMF65_15705 [Acidimicrobiales bacterium]|nr:hypothetical protein [Acidimicrobiales bacterium]